MDLSIPGFTNYPLSTPSVFADNVQDLLNTGALNVNPSAIITVNSIADTVDDHNSGVITLRDAINQANADAGEDLIVFDRSLFSNAQTITLSGTELDITHNLDIIAPRDPLTGGDLVTVNGNKASRVFEIETGATVNLNGLIVADGSVKDDSGGGIKNSGTLTLDSSIVRNNSATGTPIPVTSVTSNGKGYGGPTFIPLGGQGGGIYSNANASLTLKNSTISGNSATYDGGGIRSSYMTINNSTISGNSANVGGGISSGSANLTVNNSTISGNSANLFGGGIDYEAIANLTVNNSTISGNSANNAGGGISKDSNGGTVNINNSTISGNSTSGDGGGGDGGGIFNNGGILKINNSTISGNSANNAGGGINSYQSTLEVNSSTISGNSANRFGGGIFNDFPSTATIDNSTIRGNSANNAGGGIFNSYYGTLKLLFSTVTQNQAVNGGGVYQNDVPSRFIMTRGSNNVRNTIIASNLNSDGGVDPDVSGTFTSNGYNLIGSSTGSTGFGTTGDIVGTSDNPIDPRLAPLDFYGGSTQTIALLPDSPAIDAGDPTILDTDPTTDQRGFPRVSNGRTDIGAFEFSS